MNTIGSPNGNTAENCATMSAVTTLGWNDVGCNNVAYPALCMKNSGRYFVFHYCVQCSFIACYSNPCQNGGTCTTSADCVTSYTCTCNDAYSGTLCETQKGVYGVREIGINYNVALIFSSQLNPNSGYCYAMDRSSMAKTQAAAAAFCANALPTPSAKLATINDAADLADLVSRF
jgi:hypothetical protein